MKAGTPTLQVRSQASQKNKLAFYNAEIGRLQAPPASVGPRPGVAFIMRPKQGPHLPLPCAVHRDLLPSNTPPYARGRAEHFREQGFGSSLWPVSL